VFGYDSDSSSSSSDSVTDPRGNGTKESSITCHTELPPLSVDAIACPPSKEKAARVPPRKSESKSPAERRGGKRPSIDISSVRSVFGYDSDSNSSSSDSETELRGKRTKEGSVICHTELAPLSEDEMACPPDKETAAQVLPRKCESNSLARRRRGKRPLIDISSVGTTVFDLEERV